MRSWPWSDRNDAGATTAALVLALEQTCQVEPDRRAQITEKRQTEGWQATAEFLASLRQSEALQLRP